MGGITSVASSFRRSAVPPGLENHRIWGNCRTDTDMKVYGFHGHTHVIGTDASAFIVSGEL